MSQELVKPTEVNIDTNALLQQTLWSVMQKYIEDVSLDVTLLNKFDITLSPKSKQLLTKLVTDKDFFNDIESKLKLVIKDDKIDANDVPVILDLFQDIYAKCKSIQWKKIKAQDCGNVLRCIIKIAIAEDIIQLNVPDVVIIACVNTLIDNAIQLMNLMDGCMCC